MVPVSVGAAAFVGEQHGRCGGARQFTAGAPSLLSAYATSECTAGLHCLAWLHHPYAELRVPRALFDTFLFPASSHPDVPFDTIVMERIEAVAPLAAYIAKRKGLSVPDSLPAYQMAHYEHLYGSSSGTGSVLAAATFKYKSSRTGCVIDSDTGELQWNVPPSPDDPRGRELTQQRFARCVRSEDLARLEVEMTDLIAELQVHPTPLDVSRSVTSCALDVDQGVSSRALFDNGKTMLFLLHAVCLMARDMEDFKRDGMSVSSWGTDPVTVYSVERGVFKDDWKRPIPGGFGRLACLTPKEAPTTLRMFNMIWAWVLCMVRSDSDQPSRCGSGMDKVFVVWLRRMAPALLPADSPALDLLK